MMRIAVPLCLIMAATLSSGTSVPTYGTYFGGTGDINSAVAVAVDTSGNVIVAGFTTSQTLPGTKNAFQPSKATGFPDNRDVFIAKFSPSGTTLLWSTFLGGGGDDIPTAVAVDQAGSIYVIGTSTSSNLNVTAGAYLSSSSGGNGFAAKISADGQSLVYLTYLPGVGNAFVINGSGEAYIAGAFSLNVVTPGAIGNPVPPTQGSGGVSLLRLNSTGTGIGFDAYIGGGGFNGSKTASVAIDQQGNVYVAGSTTENTQNVPVTANALQGQLSNGSQTGFVVEVDPTGSQLLYGTYFGPQYSTTQVTNLTLASDGSIYFSGLINTDMLLATPGAYLASPAPGFVAKLTPGKTTLDAFSFLDNNGTMFSAGIGNQPQRLYIGFSLGSGPGKIIELNVPMLSLASSYSLPQGMPTAGFGAISAALAPPSSLWLVGLCGPCSLGSLISSNAFQSSPETSNAAFLVQLTNISPAISFIGSSATGTSPFAANQLISIYGTQLGPQAASGTQVGPDGGVTSTNSGTQVLFDGVTAPILFTSASQVNAVIPCSVAGQSSTQLVVEYQGAQSAPLTVALSPAAPGIFTDSGSGTGQGAVLNQDYSLNSPSNPAARGSFVSLYATGIGPTSPCVDGQIFQNNFPTATLPMIVGVGSTGAHVLYAGQAPDLVSGVAQFTVVIPDNATGVLPLTLVVDGIFSTPGVTIAVK